jgi:hypothetical protein
VLKKLNVVLYYTTAPILTTAGFTAFLWPDKVEKRQMKTNNNPKAKP